MSTQAQVDRAISLTRELIPGFDQKVQRAASGAEQLMKSAMEAMKGKEDTSQTKELLRLGKELARKK